MISFTKPLALGLLGAACAVAAAGGGYLAMRNDALPGTPASASAPSAPGLPDDRSAPRGVPGPADGLAASGKPVAGAVTGTDTRGPADGAVTLPPAPAARTTRSARQTTAEPEPSVDRATTVVADLKAESAEAASRLETQAQPAPAELPLPASPPGPPSEVPAAAASEQRQAPPPLLEKVFDQLVIPADSVLGLQLESTVSTDRARVEDRVEARVTRNVNVGDRVAIPAGSRLEGTVTVVERGGKVKERGRLGVRFHTLVLPDGGRTSINTETVYREGESRAGPSAAKITGATAGGALLGAIIGGRKGAAIGGAVGAAGGTAAVMAGHEQVVVLPAGTLLTVRLLAPVTVEVER